MPLLRFMSGQTVVFANVTYHVSEFPNAAKNKIPDPMTNPAFFTESHSPPGPSWETEKETALCEALCCFGDENAISWCFAILAFPHRNLSWYRNVSKTTARLLLKPLSRQEDENTVDLSGSCWVWGFQELPEVNNPECKAAGGETVRLWKLSLCILLRQLQPTFIVHFQSS